jgi:thioredoxin reductase (NADPH)
MVAITQPANLPNSRPLYDVIVVGAGPAGLSAALYLARFRRSVLVLHDGQSRVLRIPETHNAPAFPEGIAGAELIERMSAHAVGYGAVIAKAEVTAAKRSPAGFTLSTADGRSWHGRALILATGVHTNEADLPRETHDAAVRAGVLRYCPICDGFEHIDERIGVIGCDTNGAAEALFLRQYSRTITLMPLCHPELSPAQRAELDEAGVTVVQGALRSLEPREDRMDVFLEGRADALSFDVVYPALGCRPRSELATALGVHIPKGATMPADAMMGTQVPGLFAAGDVVEGLDQISVAIGHGAMAATKAHNWLRECDQHTLQAGAGT